MLLVVLLRDKYPNIQLPVSSLTAAKCCLPYLSVRHMLLYLKLATMLLMSNT